MEFSCLAMASISYDGAHQPRVGYPHAWQTQAKKFSRGATSQPQQSVLAIVFSPSKPWRMASARPGRSSPTGLGLIGLAARFPPLEAFGRRPRGVRGALSQRAGIRNPSH
jgi:hypothetical protein